MTTLGMIGAAGTLGRVAVRKLLQRDPNLSVLGLVRRSDDELQQLARCSLSAAGLFNDQALAELFAETDVVVNVAARNPTTPTADHAARDEFYAVNALGAAVVARAAAASGTPLLHFSSVAVYECASYRPAAALPEDEPMPGGPAALQDYYDWAVNLVNTTCAVADDMDSAVAGFRAAVRERHHDVAIPVYGLSKLIGERACLNTLRPVCCPRLSDVYGPGHESRGVVTDHLRALSSSDVVHVDLGFRSRVAFLYIDDVVDFISQCARGLAAGEQLPRVVNLPGTLVSRKQFCKHLRQLAAASGDAKVRLAPPADQTFDRRYRDDRLRRRFPNLRRTPLAEGLENTWSSFSRGA